MCAAAAERDEMPSSCGCSLLDGEIDVRRVRPFAGAGVDEGGDDFFEVWGGIAGVQSTLSALLSSRTAAAARTSRESAPRRNVAERFRTVRQGATSRSATTPTCRSSILRRVLTN